MKLIREEIEDVEILSESNDAGEKTYYIQGTFLVAEQKNKNGRIYPQEVMDKEVNRYIAEMVNSKRAVGQLNHPPDATMDLQQVSHLIESLVKQGNTYYGKAKLLDTPCGKIAQNLLAGGVKLGVSSRGLGELKAVNGVNIVQPGYTIITAADIVFDPSGPNCWVNGIMESADWVMENGIWTQRFVEEAQKTIKKTSKKDIEKVSLKIFEEYIKRL